MTPATLATDLLRASGARTKARLIALVEHFCAAYSGADRQREIDAALEIARRTIFDFED